MADIFISYVSADRPRAERLKMWFEDAGWTVWIDRDIGLAEQWEARIHDELNRATIVVVLWGAEARRSSWVQREANWALESGRLLQVHATSLPLLPPFDAIQAVRMQSWSGEEGHSERLKLLHAVADRIGAPLPLHINASIPEEDLTPYYAEISEALELALYYCARQVERVRLQRDRGYGQPSDFEEIRTSFEAMLTLLRRTGGTNDDREGVLHRLTDDFLDQLLLFAPDSNALK